MRVPIFRAKFITVILFSFLYGVILASLPHGAFRDRDSYLIYAIDSLDIISNYSGLSVITNEPLFLLLNGFLSFFISPDSILFLFVFFITFTVSFFVLIKSNNLILGALGLILLIVIPQAFHMQLVVLRQAISASLLMWFSYLFWNRRFFLLLVFGLGFIHSSMFMVFMFLVFDKFFSLFISNKIVFRAIIITFLSAAISFIILPAAELLSMRQAEEYSQVSASVSGGNFILYLTVLLIVLTQRKKKFSHDGIYVIAVVGISIYLGMYFFSPLAGRLITTFIPFIICVLCYFVNIRSFVLILSVIIINLLLFQNVVENNTLTREGVFILRSW